MPDLLPVFEALPDCYLVLSPELVILAVTDSYLKTTLMQRENLVGKHLFVLLTERQGTPEADRLQQLAHSLHLVLDSKQPQHMPAQLYLLPDPQAPDLLVERYWKLSNTPVLDKTGTVLSILHKIEDITNLLRQDWKIKELTQLEDTTQLNFQDITKMKRAEEEIKKGKDLLEAVFDASLNGIEVFKPGRNATGEITDFEWLLVNRTTERYAGRSNLSGQKWIANFPGGKPSGLFDQFKRVVEEKQTLEFEHHYQNEEFEGWFHTLAMPFGDGLIATWMDITNRKKAEEELKNKAELLQTIVDTAFGGMALLVAIRDDKGDISDFRYTMVNPVQALNANTTPEDLVGNTLLSLSPGVKNNGLWERMLRVMETGETIRFLEEYHRDGLDRWFDQHYVKIADGLLIWSIDITPIKKTEKELRASEERFRQLIDALPQMAWTATVDGSSTYFNQRSYEYTGLTFEQIKDWGWAQIYPEEEYAQVEMEWKHAIATGQIYRKQSRMRRWDGAYRWQLVIAQPVWDQAGAITFWVGTVTDVHEQVLAEEKLHQSRQLLKAVLDASINGIQAFKIIRNEENQIQDFEWILTNQVTDSLFQRNDLVGQRLTEQYPGTKKTNIFKRLKQVAESGLSKHFEVWYDHEGFHHWFQFILVKLGDGAALTFQDITRRKLLEKKQLQWRLQKQKELFHAILETEEREKKRISESLHNGLGQMLFAVRMQLGLINPTESLLTLEQKIAAWQKADELITHSIDLTRTISHELTPALLETFGLRTVIEDIGRSFSSSNLQLHCEVSTVSRLEKHLQTAIYRITQELANNIIKHAQATEASIAVEEKPGFVFMEAQDNGKGFELEKAHNKGVGLTGIRDRVKLLNGSFKIDSALGQGTRVTILLPLLPTSLKNPRQRKRRME
jgi:PAS domain S-box-containing protein